MGDKIDCKNYRGIPLMPHVAKMRGILERRTREIFKNKMDEWEAQFLVGKMKD